MTSYLRIRNIGRMKAMKINVFVFISLFLWEPILYDNLHIAHNRFLKESMKFGIFTAVSINMRNS